MKTGENFGVYGPSGNGKTRLVCSAMRADPDVWGDKALYVAIDPGSHKLRSVLPEDRDHLVVHTLGEPGKPLDPYLEMAKIIENKTAAKNGCQTVILDTLTTASREILQAIANSGKFSSGKHIVIESSGVGKLNVPMQGDYMAAQQSVMHLLRMFENEPYNLIAVFHDGLFEPEATSSAPAVGGPATVGRSSIAPVAGWFDNLIRLESRSVGTGASRSVEYVVHTERKGPFLAKLRLPHPTNPITEFKLNPDPVNFWHRIKELSNV
jgi:hypothetical protein